MNKIPVENPPQHDLKTHIGESVIIVGDVNGKEDVVIDGSVEGDINFRDNSVIISKSGRIKASITARDIVVIGDVKGALHASEQVTIEASGKVIGNIHAPRVSLNDGCQFKGAVDMDEIGTSSDNQASKLRLSKTPFSREHPLKAARKPNQSGQS